MGYRAFATQAHSPPNHSVTFGLHYSGLIDGKSGENAIAKV
jgi:hypothetical protein